MSNNIKLNKIRKKQKELVLLAEKNEAIIEGKVYKKSCELDKMIVEYMKNNKQMEIIFE